MQWINKMYSVAFRQRSSMLPGPVKGFTLLELLVVIAIIGIIAAILLGMINSARERGRNTARIKMVQEYIKALELARANSPTGDYPGVLNFRCLGHYDDDHCWRYNVAGGNIPEDATLNDALDDYINLPPGDVVQGTNLTVNTYEGMIYRKPAATFNPNYIGGFSKVPIDYEINYVLEGTNQHCYGGDDYLMNGAFGGGVNTQCGYAPR